MGGLYWQTTTRNVDLESRLHHAQSEKQQLGADLEESHTLIEKQLAQLNELDANLGQTKTELTSTRSRNITLQRQIATLEETVGSSRESIETLSSELQAVQQKLVEARAATVSLESVAAYQTAIKELQAKLDQVTPPAPTMPILSTNRSRSTRVVSVGPSNAFVVLNYGSAHGALPMQKMLIERGTNVLATVLISDVRENYSIAQVSPDSLRGTLQKGDLATITY